MRLGYSLLLGEYVNAENIDYVDCKNFQIVCPICKEPVFKVERQFEPQPIQYLSHYNKDKAYIDECELRVNRISKSDIQSANSLSRNQKLEYFLSVLRDAILENEYPINPENLKSVNALFYKMCHSAGVQILRDNMYELSRKNFNQCRDEDIYELFDEYIKEIRMISGTFPKTSFSIDMQKRIAFDIWKHLLSTKAKGNYSFLLFHSYIMLMMRIEEAEATRELYDFELQLHSYMRKLIDSTKLSSKKIFENLMMYPIGPPHAIENSTLLNKMASEITHEMLGCLIRLPYFEIIKKSIFSKKFFHRPETSVTKN